MTLPKPKKWAEALLTERFVYVSTQSGLRRTGRDAKGKEFFLPADASDELLGKAMVDALSASRFLMPEELEDFFTPEKAKVQYEKWILKLNNDYGYKSEREIFSKMRCCNIVCQEGSISIEPTNHKARDFWDSDGISDSDIALLEESAPMADLGKALRNCFDNCKGLGAR